MLEHINKMDGNVNKLTSISFLEQQYKSLQNALVKMKHERRDQNMKMDRMRKSHFAMKTKMTHELESANTQIVNLTNALKKVTKANHENEKQMVRMKEILSKQKNATRRPKQQRHEFVDAYDASDQVQQRLDVKVNKARTVMEGIHTEIGSTSEESTDGEIMWNQIDEEKQLRQDILRIQMEREQADKYESEMAQMEQNMYRHQARQDKGEGVNAISTSDSLDRSLAESNSTESSKMGLHGMDSMEDSQAKFEKVTDKVAVLMTDLGEYMRVQQKQQPRTVIAPSKVRSQKRKKRSGGKRMQSERTMGHDWQQQQLISKKLAKTQSELRKLLNDLKKGQA